MLPIPTPLPCSTGTDCTTPRNGESSVRLSCGLLGFYSSAACASLTFHSWMRPLVAAVQPKQRTQASGRRALDLQVSSRACLPCPASVHLASHRHPSFLASAANFQLLLRRRRRLSLSLAPSPSSKSGISRADPA